MPSTATLILVAVLALVTGWIVWQRTGHRQVNRKAVALKKLRQSRRYWGVTIYNPRCTAARRLSGRNFPLDVAPVLPVEGCRSLHCTCSYNGLPERRRRQRRLLRDRRLEVRFDGKHPERRKGDRRKRFYTPWIDPAG